MQSIIKKKECIKPIKVDRIATGATTKIVVDDCGTFSEINDTGGMVPLKAAQITLNDCLACVGCVTTAEEILVTEQSFSKLEQVVLANQNVSLAVGEGEHTLVVVSMSTEALASFAASVNISLNSVARKLTRFFKNIGVHYVIDESVGHFLSLEQTVTEFLERYRRKQEGEKNVLPLLTSACPGWICYAEKSHGSFILPYISTSKSGQQILGSLVKRRFYVDNKKEIYHVTLMACFDKKLEASRPDFKYNESRDVDCVITPGELRQALLEKNIDLLSLEEQDLDFLPIKGFNQEIVRSFEGQGSGGYLEYVLRRAAKTLFSVDLQQVKVTTLKNEDMKEATLEVEGRVVLRFLRAHGFRNIQNVVQKLKRKMKFNYDFVEIMACPSGCLNGGGQIKVTSDISKQRLRMVREIYAECEIDEKSSSFIAAHSLVNEIDACDYLTTEYRAVEANINALTIKW